MQLNDYQQRAHSTARYPTNVALHAPDDATVYVPLVYPALKLAGEAGEYASKFDEYFVHATGRDDDDKDVHALLLELGDVLWYVAECATVLGHDIGGYAGIGAQAQPMLTSNTLRLVGAATQVAEQVGKAIRDDGGMLTEKRRDVILVRLFEVMEQAELASIALGSDLDTVMTWNISKLASRMKRDVINGSGDNR